MFEQVILGP